MLSRVAAVKAPRTDYRRRVAGSSGRRREGRESEWQRPNMSRRAFTSAVLLLLVVMMCCGTGGAASSQDVPSGKGSSPKTQFVWEDGKKGETVSSLRVPGLVEIDGEVFAVAEAQLKGESDFNGIASELLALTDKASKELVKAQMRTQVLVECSSDKENCASREAALAVSQSEKKVRVRQPTTVVKEIDIYMLVGKHSRTDATGDQAADWRLLLAKGNVSSEAGNKKIYWKETDGVPCNLGDQQNSLKRLIGGGGSGVKMKDGTLVFPVEGTKKDGTGSDGKTVSLIIYSSDTPSCTLSKDVPDGGCTDPSVVEWKDKLMMMTACDGGPRRVYESGDKGDSWTEALGTLSRVWGNKHEGNVKGVGSGFITARIEEREVMLVTLPVYAKTESEEKEKEKEKGELHLWLTDNTHIVDIGPVSVEGDDVAASSLLYKSSKSGNEKEELIALYEKKDEGDTPSLGMVSVILTEQLQRVKEVLKTWKEVDERVSKLCINSLAQKDPSADTACSAAMPTAGLVGFLSGSFSESTWRDEYLGVNATVTGAAAKAEPSDGVKFTGRGAGAEWPVGAQGENQLYHFANYNFTLVATVSIDKVPEEGSQIPVMGVRAGSDDENTENSVLFGLSYNNEKKWKLLCGGATTKELSSIGEPGTTHHVVILLRNGNQGTAYVDGQRVGVGAQCELGSTESQEISHFYIGGDGVNAENTAGDEDVSVTVSNVLLYNRPLASEEIAELAKNKITIPKPEEPKKLTTPPRSPAVSGSGVEVAVSQSNSAGQRQSEHEPLTANIGAGSVSGAASIATTASSEADQAVVTVGGETVQGNGSPQTPEVSVSSGKDGETAEGTDAQEGIHAQAGEVTATALNSSLVNVSQGNNSDASSMRGSGLLPLLLLLGLWGFAAL
ncbi:putative trans-sialidase, Group V [Trypanosoma cruzi]|uniref:Trans-sialidase, putative n=2 Tax=Trypanosoma cruzi TaxID=5693 RepID=Q4DTZ9_TRYCC|nr:trans-sialidase, putative [Trypanosoma cruzi]EAN95991.1 trans-sialidase, putative [Trypanosoma cruzi]PWV03476.1 putative trans-sialidase, Group V [Trypanosoma cruzi]RNC43313.1 c71 surface protein [Trypanosoma cruzi]|eukprot:XP_817842.1 trans-sialidase [Trypanosoma cruzi strain CL Brener]